MNPSIDSSTLARIRTSVNRQRLIDTAVRLIEVPSPTRNGAAVADRLAEILTADGFEVERPDGGWPTAPAVAVRYRSGKPGRVLQFDGHLDTVHLPFVPPRVEDGIIYGSGSSDMKGGVAAMVEGLRALKDSGALTSGEILLTAHDLHEAPWGFGEQLDQMIVDGYVGDGVLIPEYQCDSVAVIGRGQAVYKVKVTRAGEPVHEVMGGIDQPSVIAAGAELIRRFGELDKQLAQRKHPVAGRESVFVGRAAGGEIYNQSPTLFEIEGTRRWLPGADSNAARAEFMAVLAQVAQQTGTNIDATFQVVREAFQLDTETPLVDAFQSVYAAVNGAPLPYAAKPFVDDGNSFAMIGKVAAITHGPRASGAHTVNEKVPIDELVRVAELYALVAIEFCAGKGERPA
jgi:acetylornithine deacetylase/succinyl-diaminopimelate desuccinylase-like protein